jgi:hypothetical protein
MIMAACRGRVAWLVQSRAPVHARPGALTANIIHM